MRTIKSGNAAVIGLALLNVVLWLVLPPNPEWLSAPEEIAETIGEIFSSTAMILMAIAIFLSTRPRWLEKQFGGLDKMYQTHRQVAIVALLLLLAHFFVIPASGVGGIGLTFGKLALFGIIFIVLLTLAPRIPLISRWLNLTYDKWRIVHKLIGVFFIFGFLHFLMVEPISLGTIPGIYMVAFSVLGMAAYAYKLLIAGFLRPVKEYVVEQVNHLNGTCVEVVLKPAGAPIPYQAGQFMFVHFEGDRTLREPHPFTISSSPREKQLRLSIRASGDWTSYLYKNLKAGTKAKISGGHGMFNYKTGGPEQIWIAGGIGITPFTSWVRDLEDDCAHRVDFFYGIRHEADALFWDEFETAAAKHDNLNVHLHLSNTDGRLTADHIAAQTAGAITSKYIYLCGPSAMTEGLARAFQKMGVPAAQIHYEEFNFR